MSEWADDFLGLVFLATFLTIFVIGFRAAFKIVAAKTPMPSGLQELLAS
jgi:hypothetical protein